MLDAPSYVAGYMQGKAAGGGGGGDITVESLSVTENGTTTAPAGTAFNPVVVDVPNTYSASDEGKVVSNGALVAQTVHAKVTSNGTIDTTLNNSVEVDVSGGEAYLQLLARTFQGRLDDANITELGERALDHCTGITSIYLPNCTSCGTNALYSCTNMKTLVLPALTGSFGGSANGCSKLEKCDLAGTQIYGSSFPNCTVLTVLVLRGSKKSLQNINAFNGTPFKSGGTGGTIYIPKSLYDHLGDGTSNDYKAATNWSTIDGYGTITWAKIEGSIYENAYADGTPIA